MTHAAATGELHVTMAVGCGDGAGVRRRRQERAGARRQPGGEAWVASPIAVRVRGRRLGAVRGYVFTGRLLFSSRAASFSRSCFSFCSLCSRSSFWSFSESGGSLSIRSSRGSYSP